MSLVIHAGLLGAAVLVSTTVASPRVREIARLTFYEAPPPPPPAVEVPEPAAPVETPQPTRRQRRIEVAEPVPVPEAPPAPAAAAPTLVQPATCSGADCAGNPTRGQYGGDPNGTAETGPASNGRGVAPMRLTPGMTPPRRIAGAEPQYTAAARRAHVEGTMVVQIEIGIDGRVRNVQVMRGLALLDDEVIRMVRQWRFTPTMHGGRPVPIYLTQRFSFRLED